MTERIQPYAEWLGRTELVADLIALTPALQAAATLDETDLALSEGALLPPLWHWFYFLPKAPRSKIGPDGHPQRGGFMPPIELPRRMFAGARVKFIQPLEIGKPAERVGTILSISEKTGKSGTLAFVTVHYAFQQNGQTCIEEEQDIVYRDEPGSPVPAPEVRDLEPPTAGAWVETVTPDPVLLFRFSAITFNGHRIHYDRTYATNIEGYPGLVVHGPLTAVLLMELVRRNSERQIAGYSFRGLAPLFDRSPFRLVGLPQGETVSLEAQGPNGKPAMTATAELA